ncbi:MAG: type II secretion system F family protein, partial [Limisphaerales bacterium]
MPSFSYVAREASSGREVRNVIEANTEQEAIAQLLGRNLLVVTIQEASGKKGKAASGAVPLQDLVMFTRQLATMIDAGIAIVGSLQGLAEQTDNKIMRDVIRDICARVESGDNFSTALTKHPKTFERLYCCMVDAGE